MSELSPPLSWPTFPEQLVTERLTLLWPSPEHAGAILASLIVSWPELSRWMHWTKRGLMSLSEMEQMQIDTRECSARGESLHYSMFLSESGAFVGKISLFDIDPAAPRATIGYWIDSRYVGRGLMTEAADALTRLALETLGFARVQIDCDARNERSASVARRCGYELEGCLRSHGRATDDSLKDTLIFSKIAGADEKRR